MLEEFSDKFTSISAIREYLKVNKEKEATHWENQKKICQNWAVYTTQFIIETW